MKKTDYGAVVDRYQRYASDLNPDDAEFILGRAKALEALGDVSGKRVLDFGCGPATNGKKLSEAGAHVIGFDADAKVIAAARANDPDGDYRTYRGLLANEFPETSINHILMSFSLCVIPDREARYILQDMFVLLSTGGKLVIVEPNLERALGVQYRTLHYHHKEGVQTGDHVEVTLGSGEDAILLTDDIYRRHADYRELLEEAGFKIERMEEPVPGNDWGAEWELERQYPPFLLIVAR